MRDPQASEPFDPRPGGELETVLSACHARSEFLGKTAEFLAYTAAHISMLSGGYRQELVRLTPEEAELRLTYQDPIDSSYIRGEFLYWRRPKNEKQVGVPIKREMKPWLAEYLDAPRPRSRLRYWQLFHAVGEDMRAQVNPLRFRHTAFVLWKHVLKLDSATICKLGGVTPSTLVTYVDRPQWMVLEQMRGSGW